LYKLPFGRLPRELLKEVVIIFSYLMLVLVPLIVAIALAYLALEPWYRRRRIQRLLLSAGISAFTDATYPLHITAEHSPNGCNGCPTDGTVWTPPHFFGNRREVRVYVAVDGTGPDTVAVLRPISLLVKQNKEWRATGWRISQRQVRQ